MSKPHAWANRFWPPLAVYSVTALVQVLMLAWMLPADGPTVRDKLLSWDAVWYVDIAEHGYPDGFEYDSGDKLKGNTLAFFPLFPALVKVVHELTRLDYGTAGLVAGHLCTAVALCLVYVLLTRLFDRRTGLIMTALVGGAQPMAVVFSMAYSESLFLALSAGMLIAVHRKAWLTAGVCAMFAGLTRPAAVAAVVAMVFSAAWFLYRERRFEWRPVVAAVIACLGMPGYVAWVGWRTGDLSGWFRIQDAGWGTGWDGGAAFLEFLDNTFRSGDGWVPVSTAVLLLGAILATCIAIGHRTWLPLTVFGLALIVLTFGQSNYYHSKLRLLAPALIMLVPVAVALAKTRIRTAAMVLTALTLFGAWYGAHMLVIWKYAI